MSKRLKWGVAGCGHFSEHSFIPTLSLIRKAKLNSVYSHDLKRAKQIANKFSASKFFDNYDEFLKSDIDVVYVGSANADHYKQVIKAAKAGKHILCDKPLSITSKEAEEMVKVCKENNVYLAVNYLYRFHPLAIKTKEFIDSQLIGKLVSIKLGFNVNFLNADNFRYNKKLSGGGALRDLGTHLIDLLRYFGGEIISINGVMDNILYKTQVEDYAEGMVKFEKSGYGYFQVSFCTSKALNRISILGTKGGIFIDNLIGSKFPSSAKFFVMLEDEGKKIFRKRANNLYRLLRSVNKSFLKNQAPLITGEDGLINMKLMEEFESKCITPKNL